MNINDIMLSSSDLFRKGKFSECCEILQHTVNNFNLKNITTQDEVEFVVLRNNLLVCNCLRILPVINTEYVDKMTELINMSKLYLYEEHIPLELRVNFVCNTLLWYWFKPMEVHDYCYNEIIQLVNECLHKVLHESGKSSVNLSLNVGKEQDILHILECLSDEFLRLEPILVVQCIEMSQILSLVFLLQHRSHSLLIHFTEQLIDNIKPIICAFKYKKINHIANCFKLGLFKINNFLDTEYIKNLIVSGHVSLCIKHILENQHQQALCTLSIIDQYLDDGNELFCLVYYLIAIANFNLEAFDVTLYYLSQMSNCLMEPFIKSRCYLLLGRTHSKMGNGDLALEAFEKLKESSFSNVMAYYISCHYEQNNMHFTQMLVLEQAIKGDFDKNNDCQNDFSISYMSKVLTILYPQPDLTKKQLLYMAAKKKYEYSSYKLAGSAYLSLLKSNESEQNVSDLVTIPSTFMLRHEAAVALLKAREMDEAFKLCQSLIGEFEPGCGMWESDSFWANELNDYNFNVIGTMLLAETGLNKNTNIVLEALNKSFEIII
ncbi:Hypothetical protein CINCED_3A000914 [Cinara cedri]|uniref:Tetratricopeptide-like helical domain n=1 Tax=Cinara cedri TaxID=506608 RepID=A0A5E4LZS7_9HEMI|nr:Hypothetical protein CINCED_3A000914 [Cinara cedri]